jgi:two-component system response regulator YesN
MNFSTFLKDFRLSHAKRLLSGTDMRIYEIASEVGYSDSKYFNRVFKEKYGISPGEFRQQV